MTTSIANADQPGRSCPLHYRYSPSVFNRSAEICAETLYVIGGLYGNPFALERIFEIAQQETVKPMLVFNGDFNWFNIDHASFRDINLAVLAHHALRGNVETELASDDANHDASAGCGCAYPENVCDAEVEYSNRIMGNLQATAANFPELRQRLTALPMHLVAEVGGVKIGVMHGDAHSLAGWDFSRETLLKPSATKSLQHDFAEANVKIFACTHTCLPVIKTLPLTTDTGLIVNNGSAGMANFRDTTDGLITRISCSPFPLVGDGGLSQSATRAGDLYVDLLRVDFDSAAWTQMFLSNWPEGSAAHASYFKRITQGPAFAGDVVL
jgi:predicted phosphodiesterase